MSKLMTCTELPIPKECTPEAGVQMIVLEIQLTAIYLPRPLVVLCSYSFLKEISDCLAI